MEGSGSCTFFVVKNKENYVGWKAQLRSLVVEQPAALCLLATHLPNRRDVKHT
jgi:hypothetical protein